MLGTMVAPLSLGSSEVEFGYRVELSQKYPFPGKRGLRGQNALAEANAAENDLADMRLQLIENARHVFYEYYLVDRALAVNEETQKLLKAFREKVKERYEKVAGAAQQDIFQADVEIGRQESARAACVLAPLSGRGRRATPRPPAGPSPAGRRPRRLPRAAPSSTWWWSRCERACARD